MKPFQKLPRPAAPSASEPKQSRVSEHPPEEEMIGEFPVEDTDTVPMPQKKVCSMIFCGPFCTPNRGGQSYNEPHREFLLHRDEYLRIILEREAVLPDQVGTCGHRLEWKCISCHDGPTYCTPCLRAAHQSNPLHRIQHWSGKFWEDAWLRQAGTIIQLGHRGDRCPELVKGVRPNALKPDDDDECVPELEDMEDSDWDDDDEVAPPSLKPVRCIKDLGAALY